MKTKSNQSDYFDDQIKIWQNDFEAPNPYLVSIITEKLSHQNNITIFPFRISKMSLAIMLVVGLFSAYFLHIFTEQNINHQNIAQQEQETIMLQKYAEEMYITEIKQSEIEDFFKN